MLKKLFVTNAFGGSAADLSFPFPGDTIAGAEIISTLSTAGNGVWTAQLISGGIIRRTGPTAAYTDTTTTANEIIAAIIAATNSPSQAGISVQPGTTFRVRFVNTVAQVLTLAAGTGVILGTDTGCAASISKDYLFTVLDGTPQAIVFGNTTNGSAVVTGADPVLLQRINVGQAVSGSGVPANATIVGVNSAAGTLTLSANATSTLSAVAFTCSPRVRVDGI